MPEELFHMDSDEIDELLESGEVAKPNGTQAKIVGGTTVELDIWPHTVGIYRYRQCF